uniref:Uncharacterized protein n=1 Tax=Arundo donax TaxID=35708 RepID=A0A0A8YQR6_ARUDO
MRQIRSYKSV